MFSAGIGEILDHLVGLGVEQENLPEGIRGIGLEFHPGKTFRDKNAPMFSRIDGEFYQDGVMIPHKQAFEDFPIKAAWLSGQLVPTIALMVAENLVGELNKNSASYEERIVSWALITDNNFELLSSAVRGKIERLKLYIKNEDIDDLYRITQGKIQRNKNKDGKDIGVSYDGGKEFVYFTGDEFSELTKFWKENNGETYSGKEMVPSDETIDKVLQPFYWVKDRVKQSMEDGFLSPFPKFKDANPEWTDILKDYLIDFDANSIDKGKYPFFVEKMLMISDFLKKDSMDIFMSYDRFQNGVRVNLIQRGILHNQYDIFINYDEMELIICDENDPFNELSAIRD